MYKTHIAGNPVDMEMMGRLRSALDELFEFNGDNDGYIEKMNERYAAIKKTRVP